MDEFATCLLKDESATCAFGHALSSILREGDVLCLWGDLGVGKSTLARAIIQAELGDTCEVPSPTFTLIQTYPFRDTELWHCDLYRLTDASEVDELGLEEAFQENICLIEWPDRFGENLPKTRLDIIVTSEDIQNIEPSQNHHILENPLSESRMLQLRGNQAWQDRLNKAATIDLAIKSQGQFVE